MKLRNIYNYKFTILIIFIIITLATLFIITEFREDTKEGFGNYNDCLSKGYTKEFCLTTPVANFGPGTCQCDDGSIGRVIPGFRGECVCNMIF